MPDGLVTFISIAGSAIVTAIVSFIVNRAMKKHFDKKDAEEAKAKAALELQKTKDLEDKIDEIVDRHTNPIDTKLEELEDKLSKVADGTLDTLRDRILSSYYKCYEKGYRSQYDIDNMSHLHADYLNLNGNSFVKECMEKFKNIPTEQEWQIIQKQKKKKTTRSKKQILVE